MLVVNIVPRTMGLQTSTISRLVQAEKLQFPSCPTIMIIITTSESSHRWQTHQKPTSGLASVSFNFLSEARRRLRELLLQTALNAALKVQTLSFLPFDERCSTSTNRLKLAGHLMPCLTLEMAIGTSKGSISAETEGIRHRLLHLDSP
jgi:hypothetical protein